MIQVYTGEGKGKTTAAVGLAVRAIGAGQKVLFLQVLKKGDSSEVKILQKIPGITYKAFGTGAWIDSEKENKKEKQRIIEAMEYIKNNINKYQIIIADEVVTAIWLKLIQGKEVTSYLKERPNDTEIVLTGHQASTALIKEADLVTEMKPIKHYYKKGIRARKGIEL